MAMITPTKSGEKRGFDVTGCGWYGASRGNRKHEGVDYVAAPGDPIVATHDGVVRVGQVYRDSPKMKLIEISGARYKGKTMYVDPIVANGEKVCQGDLIGYAQDIAKYHNDSQMKNHVHQSLWKFGLLTDPEPVLK